MAVGGEPVERARAPSAPRRAWREAIVGLVRHLVDRRSRARSGGARRPRSSARSARSTAAARRRRAACRAARRLARRPPGRHPRRRGARGGRPAPRSRGRSARSGRRAPPRPPAHRRGSERRARRPTRRPTAVPDAYLCSAARRRSASSSSSFQVTVGAGLGEAPEAPDGQGERPHARRGGDGRRARGLVDERDLAERGAGPERGRRSLPPTETSAVPLSTTKKLSPPSPSVAISWPGSNSRSMKSVASWATDASSRSAKIGIPRIRSALGCAIGGDLTLPARRCHLRARRLPSEAPRCASSARSSRSTHAR